MRREDPRIYKMHSELLKNARQRFDQLLCLFDSSGKCSQPSGAYGRALAAELMQVMHFGAFTANRTPSIIQSVFDGGHKAGSLLESAIGVEASQNGKYVRSMTHHPQREIYQMILDSLMGENSLMDVEISHFKAAIKEDIVTVEEDSLRVVRDAISSDNKIKNIIVSMEAGRANHKMVDLQTYESEIRAEMATLRGALSGKEEDRNKLSEAFHAAHGKKFDDIDTKKDSSIVDAIGKDKWREFKKIFGKMRGELTTLRRKLDDHHSRLNECLREMAYINQVLKTIESEPIDPDVFYEDDCFQQACMELRAIDQAIVAGQLEGCVSKIQQLKEDYQQLSGWEASWVKFKDNVKCSVSLSRVDSELSQKLKEAIKSEAGVTDIETCLVKNQVCEDYFQKLQEDIESHFKQLQGGVGRFTFPSLGMLECMLDSSIVKQFSRFSAGSFGHWDGGWRPPQEVVEELLSSLSPNHVCKLAVHILEKKMAGLEELTPDLSSLRSKACSKSVLAEAPAVDCLTVPALLQADPLVQMMVPENKYPCVLFDLRPLFNELGLKVLDAAKRTCLNHVLLSRFCGLVNRLCVERHGVDGAIEMQPQQSFGSPRPQITDTGDAFRCSLGFAPAEYAEVVFDAYKLFVEQLHEVVQSDEFTPFVEKIVSDERLQRSVKQNANRVLLTEFCLATSCDLMAYLQGCQKILKAKNPSLALFQMARRLPPVEGLKPLKATAILREILSRQLRVVCDQEALYKGYTFSMSKTGYPDLSEAACDDTFASIKSLIELLLNGLGERQDAFADMLSVVEVNQQLLTLRECMIISERRRLRLPQADQRAMTAGHPLAVTASSLQVPTKQKLTRQLSDDCTITDTCEYSVMVKSARFGSGMRSFMVLLAELFPTAFDEYDELKGDVIGPMYFELNDYILNGELQDYFAKVRSPGLKKHFKWGKSGKDPAATSLVMLGEFSPFTLESPVDADYPIIDLNSIMQNLQDTQRSIPEIMVFDVTCHSSRAHDDLVAQFHSRIDDERGGVKKPYAIITYSSDNKTAKLLSTVSSATVRMIACEHYDNKELDKGTLTSLGIMKEWFSMQHDEQPENSTSNKAENTVNNRMGLLRRTRIKSDGVSLRHQLDLARDDTLATLRRHQTRERVLCRLNSVVNRLVVSLAKIQPSVGKKKFHMIFFQLIDCLDCIVNVVSTLLYLQAERTREYRGVEMHLLSVYSILDDVNDVITDMVFLSQLDVSFDEAKLKLRSAVDAGCLNQASWQLEKEAFCGLLDTQAVKRPEFQSSIDTMKKTYLSMCARLNRSSVMSTVSLFDPTSRQRDEGLRKRVNEFSPGR